MTEDDFFFDGKKFISAKRAAELTGYTHDYIGQLGRAGKVKSELIGRNRFVEEESLMRHYESSIEESKVLPRVHSQQMPPVFTEDTATAPMASSAHVLDVVSPAPRHPVTGHFLHRPGRSMKVGVLAMAFVVMGGATAYANNLYLPVQTIRDVFAETNHGVTVISDAVFEGVVHIGDSITQEMTETTGAFEDVAALFGDAGYEFAVLIGEGYQHLARVPDMLLASITQKASNDNAFISRNQLAAVNVADEGIGKEFERAADKVVAFFTKIWNSFFGAGDEYVFAPSATPQAPSIIAMPLPSTTDTAITPVGVPADATFAPAIRNASEGTVPLQPIYVPRSVPVSPGISIYDLAAAMISMREELLPKIRLAMRSPESGSGGVGQRDLDNYLLLSGGTLTGELIGTGLNFDGGTLRVDPATDRVGIGTTSPADTFSVNGAVFLANVSPASTGNRLYADSIGDLYWSGNLVAGTTTGTWQTSGGNVYRTTGNVGIGTTSPAVALDIDSTDALHIPAGTTAQRPGNAVNGYLRFNTTTLQFEGYNGSTWSGLGGVTDVDQNTYILGELSPGSNDDTLFFTTAGSEKMRITSAGNLGVGTTSPYAKLSVAGQVVGEYFTATSSNASVFPYASTTALSVSGPSYLGSLTGPLQAINGLVSATGTLSVVYGGTGLSMPPSYGHLLVGNSSGGYSLVATSTLKINTDDTVEGLSNLYFTNARADARINATTSVSTLTSLPNLAIVGTITSGVWNAGALTTSGVLTSNGTGNNYFSGNVGIGTTSPYAKLSVVGETVAEKFTATSTTATSTFNGGLFVGTSTNSSFVVDRLSGFIGIGTNAPRALVELSSNLNITANPNTKGIRIGNMLLSLGIASASETRFAIRDITSNSYRVLFGDGTREISFGDSTLGALLRINSSNASDGFSMGSGGDFGIDAAGITNGRFVVKYTSGNVGIGTTSPWRTLSVNGTVGLSSALTSGTTGNYLCINTSTFEVTSGTTCSASSARFKENIIDLAYGLDEIKALRPVTFTYKKEYNPDGSTRLGLIAEEVEDVIPEVVNRDKNGLPESVSYDNLIALLIKGIQELSARLDRIETQLAGMGETIHSPSSQSFDEFCVGETCVTESQFRELLETANIITSIDRGESHSRSSVDEPPTHEAPIEEPQDEPVQSIDESPIEESEQESTPEALAEEPAF